MFLGREKEIKQLDRLYASDKFEFAVIYGRRRVGKTTILNEFVKGKPAICLQELKPTKNKILKI